MFGEIVLTVSLICDSVSVFLGISVQQYSKAIAAAAAGGIGAAIAVIVVYVFKLVEIDLPDDVRQAVEVLIVALLTAITGGALTYAAPANKKRENWPPRKPKK